MAAEILALLTRLRVSRAPMDLAKAARRQHLFPLVGLLVGLIAAAIGWLLFTYLGEGQTLVSAGLLLASLYFVTGILHTEGLSDFADGMMASGTQERKREAMKDVRTGVAGVMAVVMFLILFFSAITSLLDRGELMLTLTPLPWEVPVFFGLVLSELSGKLAMNVSIFLGPSAHPGMGSIFVQASSAMKIVAAILIAAILGLMVAGWLAVLLALGLFSGLAVTLLARKNFGGVSGDSFGAANEVGRLVTLLGWVLLI